MKTLAFLSICTLSALWMSQAISQPNVCLGTDMPGGVFTTSKASIVDQNGTVIKDITAEVARICNGKASCVFVMTGGLPNTKKAVVEGTCNEPAKPASFSTEFGAKTIEFACPCIPVEA